MTEEFIKIFNKITTSISLIFATFTSVLGIEWTLFAGYLILNILDYFTGTIKSKLNKNESSDIGFKGILKKICYWILIFISFLISFLLVQIGLKINLELNFIMFFGWFTLTCLIINEARSILENLVEIGIDIPIVLKKGLEVYQDKVESKLDNFIKK